MKKSILLNSLKVKNQELINKAKINNSLDEAKKYEIIQNILSVEDVFNKISYDVAINILLDLKINKDKLFSVYKILIGEE